VRYPQLVKPRKGRTRFPGGPGRIDLSAPITAALSYFRGMYWISERPDFIARGSDGISGPLTGGSNSLAPLGMGLSVPGAAMPGSAPTYSYPAAAGSIFGFVTASFSPTDSLAHKVVAGNAPESTLSYIELQKADDNNWYFGWFGSSDTRVSAAATGTYSAGDSFVVGGTWTTAGGTNLYVKGKLLANNPTAPNTSGFPFGNNFSIGSSTASTDEWVTTAYRDAIYWVGIWDRVLTNAEIQSLSADPFQFLVFQEDFVLSELTNSPGSADGAASGSGGAAGAGRASNKVFLTKASTSPWPLPAGWPGIATKVESIGAGGSGASTRVSASLGSAGGGGGEYAAATNVIITSNPTFSVGAGGTGAAGTLTSLAGASVTVAAHPGGNGAASTPGAAGTGSTNTVHFNGGIGLGRQPVPRAVAVAVLADLMVPVRRPLRGRAARPMEVRLRAAALAVQSLILRMGVGLEEPGAQRLAAVSAELMAAVRAVTV
jgi:hypothetical protein